MAYSLATDTRAGFGLSLYEDGHYIASYEKPGDALMDLQLKKGGGFINLDCHAISLLPRYRIVIRRLFQPIDAIQKLIFFADSINETVNYVMYQKEFSDKFDKYFDFLDFGIHLIDPESGNYQILADDDKSLKEICAQLSAPKPLATVFISHASEDAELGQRVYDKLSRKGFEVFFSPVSLPDLGASEYMKAIDTALERAQHLVLVAGDPKNVNKPWVEAEWRLFINEKRSGRKDGNIVSVIQKKDDIIKLPMSIRYFQVLTFDPDSLLLLEKFIADNHSSPL